MRTYSPTMIDVSSTSVLDVTIGSTHYRMSGAAYTKFVNLIEVCCCAALAIALSSSDCMLPESHAGVGPSWVTRSTEVTSPLPTGLSGP